MSLYYPEPMLVMTPSKKELSHLYATQQMAYDHSSGGSYDMVVTYRKGSIKEYGFNKLKRLATTIHDSYPEDLGVHAELDLFRRMNGEFDGGTVYVAGKLSSSGSDITTTRPCAYCSVILFQCGIRNAVYFQDNEPTKCLVRDLVNHE